MQSSNNYSFRKSENVFKAVFNVCLPLVYFYVCYGIDFGILFFIPATIGVSVLYAILYFINTNRIKNDEVTSIKPFILNDLLYSVLPAVCSCIFNAIVLNVFFDIFEDIWLFASILLCVFVLIALYFWFRYYISNNVVKRLKLRKDSRP